MSNELMLIDHDARLKRIEQRLRLPPYTPKPKRCIDPKFRHILRRSMQEKGLNQSDLAVLLKGPRKMNREGKMSAKGKDLVSRWLSGEAYPSDKYMSLLAQFVDVV